MQVVVTNLFESHRHSEGLTPTKRTLSNVKNIEQRVSISEEPVEVTEVCLTEYDESTHKFNSAVADLSETEPEVDIYLIRDETTSREFSRVVHYTGYGIQSETYEDMFETERTRYSMLINDCDGNDVHYHPHSYRGFVVKSPDGDTTVLGTPDAHSQDVQTHYPETPSNPPYSNQTGTFEITADGLIYDDVVNVSRAECDVFDLHHHMGGVTRTEDITDATGPLYTVTVRHRDTFGHGVMTTSVKRATGVYIRQNQETDQPPSLTAIGNPDSASVCKAPKTYHITNLNDVHNLVLKMPTGEIINSVENIPTLK